MGKKRISNIQFLQVVLLPVAVNEVDPVWETPAGGVGGDGDGGVDVGGGDVGGDVGGGDVDAGVGDGGGGGDDVGVVGDGGGGDDVGLDAKQDQQPSVPSPSRESQRVPLAVCNI